MEGGVPPSSRTVPAMRCSNPTMAIAPRPKRPSRAPISVVRLACLNQRVSGAPMEPRAAIADL